MALLTRPHQEIIRFDVSVKEASRVKVLHPRYHLVSDHEDCLEAEFTTAVVEHVLKRGA